MVTRSRIWLISAERALTAERRVTLSTRIDSITVVVSLGMVVARPDKAARAAITASIGSDLPCPARTSRSGVFTSTTSAPAVVRYRVSPEP